MAGFSRIPMSQRTTLAAVQAILRDGTEGGDYDDVHNPSLQPFVDSATVIVDRVRQGAIDKGMDLTAAELELVERWLSAHMYSMSDKPYVSRSTSNSAGAFSGQTGKGFDATLYGQTAMQLDWSGTLKALNINARAGAFWLGKNPTDQIDYETRR